MNILIYDQKEINIEKILKDPGEETVVISDNGKIQPCCSCFCCWIKTPGQCAIKDGYENTGALFSRCSQLIIISQCFYGGYSPFVKNVYERGACQYLLPYLIIKNGETHHPKRYDNNIALSVHFYGKISEAEKETARKLIKANEKNLFNESAVYFYDSFEEIKGV
jgi:multimeric flavodoxin WrbA